MASGTQNATLSTDVYQDGTEQAVRSNSQHSRAAHVPKTDAAGNVIFDADGFPLTECDVDHDDAEWVLRPIQSVRGRDKCRRCFAADEVADQNQTNGGSSSFARRLRYGDDWGDE